MATGPRSLAAGLAGGSRPWPRSEPSPLGLCPCQSSAGVLRALPGQQSVTPRFSRHGEQWAPGVFFQALKITTRGGASVNSW